MSDDTHSLVRHPMREMLTDEEWRQLANDVQFCRVSWPIGVHYIKTAPEVSDAEQ